MLFSFHVSAASARAAFRKAAALLLAAAFLAFASAIFAARAAHAAPGYAILHTFNAYGDGTLPGNGLITGIDGNFYGTTLRGGTNDNGTVYRITPAGALTTIHSFTGSIFDGIYPTGTLTQDSNGNLYGVTSSGGPNGSGGSANDGAIYKLSADGTSYSVLYVFSSTTGDDSINPVDGVTYSNGCLYGATANGGTNGYGTIYKINADGTGYTTLAQLDASTAGSGYNITAPFIISGTTIYGTAAQGGANGGGTLFSLTTSGGSYATLYPFTYNSPNPPGNSPSGLTLGIDGNFYGVTNYGGLNGGGSAFSYNPGTHALTDVHDFNPYSGDQEGYLPINGLVQDPSTGLLYGSTTDGASGTYGSVFQMTTSGSVQALAAFSYNMNAISRLAFGSGKAVYTTENAGADYNGTISSISTSSSSGVSTLFDFANAFHDGELLNGGAIMLGSDGALHGTTSMQTNNESYGTAYRLTLNGLSYTQDYVLPGNAYGGLAQGPNGAYYGLTYNGGYYGAGSFYSFMTDEADSGEDEFDFGQAAGGDATGGLVLGHDGNFYGVTNSGGQRNDGAIFSITPDGYETALYSFKNGADGEGPIGSLVQDASGNLYGVTASSTTTGQCMLFKFAPSTKQFTTLTTSYASYASYNNDYLTLSRNTIYGTTTEGGANSCGSVFRINTDGSGLTTLHSFTRGTTDGYFPITGVALGTDGNLYGVTQEGGANDVGAIYVVAPDGSSESLLHSFNYGVDGFFPEAKMLEGPDGNFYGTASDGGIAPAGETGPNVEGIVYQLQTLLPIVTAVSPSSGAPGASVTLTGVNLAGATSVTFNGTAATIKSDTATSLTVTVPSGATSGPVMVVTTNGSYTTSSTFTVTAPAGPAVRQVTLSPTSVQGGTAATTANRVYLTSAPSANITVALASSNTAVATVPSSVTISSGSTSHTFTITTKAVTSQQTVIITAAYNGSSQSATLTVTPPPSTLKSVTLSPTSTEGGTSTTANRVYWSGNAPSNETVTLSSSNTAVAAVPSLVTISSGSSSHVFTVTTKAVTSQQTVTITATSGGVTQTATLTVTP